MVKLTRIVRVEPLRGHRLRLWLTTGAVVERDVAELLWGPVFERIRTEPAEFARVRARHGTVVWPGDVDICADVLIWGGMAPSDRELEPRRRLVLKRAWLRMHENPNLPPRARRAAARRTWRRGNGTQRRRPTAS